MSTIKVKTISMTMHFKKKPEKVVGTCAGCVLERHGRCEAIVSILDGCGGDSILKFKKITP